MKLLAILACLLATGAYAQNATTPYIGSTNATKIAPGAFMCNPGTSKAVPVECTTLPAALVPSGSLGTVSGDCSASGQSITCTKTNGTSFAPSATLDTTNASNVTSGTLPTAQLPAVPLTKLATQNAGTVVGIPLNGSRGSPAAIDPSGLGTIATGTFTARALADRAADTINVKDGYNGQAGAKGDGKIASPTVTLSAISTSLTVDTSLFTAADVGKTIVIAGAGSLANDGRVQTVAITTPGSGYTSIPTCALTDASAAGSGATCTAFLSLQSVTVASGGAGCLNGTFEMVVGIDATGTVARIAGTVTSNAVSGTITIVSPGLISAMPSTLTAAAAYGANCTTAPTFALAYGVAAIQVTAPGTSYSSTQTTAALSGGSPATAATLGAVTIQAPVTPLVTTIAAYTSGTQVTLAAAGSTAISGTDKILWATDDHQAFQNALNAGNGIYIPKGIYWIGSALTLAAGANTTVRGDGMQNTILAWDAGSVQSGGPPSTTWNPIFYSTSGSATAVSGSLQLEDFQIYGLQTYGRSNTGAPPLFVNNLYSLDINRVMFYQLPFMGMANESIGRFTLTNSVFDTVSRDQARCRSCFAVRIIGNKFVHGGDDSVALHQASYIQSTGTIREGIVVEGNDFEDTYWVHLLGGRNVVVRGNSFRRTKLGAVNIAYDSNEGVNQLRNVTIADNSITDVMSTPLNPGSNCIICVSVNPPTAITGVTSFQVGANAYPSQFFAKPWDYDYAVMATGTSFSPQARGVNVHDNTMMRTLPAVTQYSAWGFGTQMTSAGFVNPSMPDVALRSSYGISVDANITELSVHHNNVQNVGAGVVLTNNVATPSQSTASITFNNIFDAPNYGIAGFGTGNLNSVSIIGNQIDLDPYFLSAGRATTGSPGSWTSGYTGSRCISLSYTASVQLNENSFSDCYAITTQPTWVIANNIIRGSPYSGFTGQLTSWSGANTGIGQYPNNVGAQFFLSPISSTPSNNTPSSYGSVSQTHVTYSAAAPTTGYHVINDIIYSSAPSTCTCVGWLTLTTGTSWTSGTDYKVIPIQ